MALHSRRLARKCADARVSTKSQADFQNVLQSMWTEKQQAGLIPAESSGNLVIAHIGLQPYNEALVMAAERLQDTVPNLLARWKLQVGSHEDKRPRTDKEGVWRSGTLQLRKQNEPQNL